MFKNQEYIKIKSVHAIIHEGVHWLSFLVNHRSKNSSCYKILSKKDDLLPLSRGGRDQRDTPFFFLMPSPRRLPPQLQFLCLSLSLFTRTVSFWPLTDIKEGPELLVDETLTPERDTQISPVLPPFWEGRSSLFPLAMAFFPFAPLSSTGLERTFLGFTSGLTSGLGG